MSANALDIRLRSDIKRLLSIAVLKCEMDAGQIASAAIRKGRKGKLKEVVVEPPKSKTTTIPVRLALAPDVSDATDEEVRGYLERALLQEKSSPWPWELTKRYPYEEGIDYTVKPWREG